MDPLGGAVDGGDDMGTVAAELARMTSEDPGGCYVHLLPSDSAGWAAVIMVSMHAVSTPASALRPSCCCYQTTSSAG
jgi:hypothetical protein